jgi:anti-sigma factor RsiW
MEITRNVILDLLPLYLADEVSEDTRTLVEEYLETDPQLANMAKQSAAAEFPGNVPVPLTEEDKMKAYRKSKWLIFIAIVVLAFLMFGILGATLLAFLLSA